MPTLDEWLAKNAPVASSPALMAAPDVAPDQAAAALQQARRNGIPTSLAPSTPDPDIERQERLQANAAALRQAPTLDQWLASQPDLVTASVQDDVEGLSRVEQAVRAVVNAGKAAQAGFFGFNEGFYGAAQATGALLPDVIGDPIERYSNQFRLESQAFAQEAMPEGEGTLARGVYSGFQSVGAMIPALAAGVATRNPNVTLGIMSGMTFGQSFGEAKDAGKDAATSLLYGFNQASIEFLTEKIPVGMLFGDLAKGTGLGTMIMRQLGAEMFGEQVATLAQDFNQWVTLNPDKTMSEFLDERPAAALETAIATVVATGAVTAGSVGADAAMRRLSGEESRAEQRQREAELLKNLNQLAGATVVRERDVNTFEGFLQSVTEGTPVEALYIDGRALLDSGLADQLAEASPAVAAQLEAAQAGTMVRIPTAEVMGRFNQELAPLLPDMRTDPNGMTQREADEYVKTRGETLRAEVETLLAVPENEVQAREDREAVRTQVASDLMATGRVTADVADTYALLTSAFYATQAKRFGMSARELYQQERVRILGEGQGELDQPGYHGSPHRFKRFDLSKIGTGEGAQAYGWGQYFADEREVAKQYTQDGMQVGSTFGDVQLHPKAREAISELEKQATEEGNEAAAWVYDELLVGDFPPDVLRSKAQELDYDAGEVEAALEKASKIASTKYGQLYTVDIPDDAIAQMLDWDKPLSQQPEFVQKVLELKVIKETEPSDSKWLVTFNGNIVSGFQTKKAANEWVNTASMGTVYEAMTISRGAKNTSTFLSKLGIPGLRYLDGNSRGAGDGTRNTVVWDQALLDRISDSMDAGQFNQTATVRAGRETLKKYGLKPDGKYKTRQVAAALEARQRDKYGSIAADDRSPEAVSKIAKWMVAEVEFEMENPEQSGVGWYSEKFQRAIDIMGDTFSELKTDKAARDTMTALIAITSDGQKVVPNFAQAMDIYGRFRPGGETEGRFTTSRGHQRQASIAENLQVLQRLYDRMGAEVMHQYLMQEKTISELKKIAKANGGKLKSDYQAHIKMPMAAVEFGPKLGAFYANLMGAHGYLTMDRWWSRTFNRYRGTLLQSPTRQGLDRLKRLLGNPEMSDDEAIAATVEPRNSYEEKGFKDGTELEKAANTIYKAAFESLEDSPFNATDRTFMLDAVNRAQKTLARRGYSLSIADIQAILWYYEKRLYGELGTRQTADISYEEAARRVVSRIADGSGIESLLDDADAASGDGGTDEDGVSPGEELYEAGDQPGPGDRFEQSAGISLADAASTIDVDGVARPTRNAEGRLLAGTEEEIRNFWRWFGDSRVVDEQGRPLVVYHGTAGDFDVFDPNRGGRTEGGAGFRDAGVPSIFFTDSMRVAEGFAEGAERDDADPRVVDAYLSIERPYIIYANGRGWPKFQDEIIEAYRSEGHDGVILHRVDDGMFESAISTVYIAFRSEQAKSATGNDGTFDEDDPSILSQQARGSFSPRELTIRLLKAQDLSTFLHESGHFYLHLLTVLASRPDAPVEVRQDVDTLLTWMGVEGSPELSRLDTWMRMSVDQQRAGHEKMARGFEVYLADGKAPSVELQQAFDRFRSWLLAVYRSLVERVRAKRGNTFGKEMQAELNDEVRAVFDRMLASEDEARNLEAAQSMGMMFRTEEEAARLGVDWTSYQRQGEAATQAAQTELTKRTIADMRWLDNARSRLLRRLQSEARDTRREVRSQVRVEVMSEPIYRVYQFLRAKVGEEDDVPNPVPKSDPDKVDPGIDDLLTAIAKLGGVNRDEAVSTWAVDLGGQRSPTPVFGKPVFRATGGETLDGMGEKLAELGYLRLDRNGKYDLAEFEEKLTQAMAGETVYSNQVRDDVLMPPAPGEGLNLEGMGGGRLDYGELRAMEGVTDATFNLLRERRMVVMKNGLSPDVVAAQFGFTSGDELVRKLAEVRPPNEEIEARTDERMLREHADLATPEGRDAAVNAALATEARARMVETELLAVERAVRADVRTAKGTTQNTLPAAARRFARDVVARIKVRELRVGQFTRSASRAAKAAMKAQTQGNLAETALEKRNELVNVYAGREAAEAHDDVRSGVEYLRKFQNEGTRKNVDPDYLDQIDAILERYELKRITNRGLDKRKALNDWIAEQEAMGITPDLPPHVADAAKRTNYRELTVEEFRGLVDSVRQIEHFGRLKKKLLLAKDRREFLAVVAEINRSVQEAAGTRRADNRTRTHVGAMLAQGFKAFTAAHRKMASIAYELDGFKDGGPVWESLVRTANERGNWEASRQAELTGKLAVLLKMLSRERRWTKGRFFPRLGISLTQEERISVALNWGNEGNRQRLLDGRTWSPMQVQSVLDTLTAEEWQFVQGVWDMFESLRPEVGAKEKRVMGKEPNWVEPTPVVTKFGTLRGGYYPISYDTGESLRAEQDADAEMAKRQLQGARTAATTRRNFVKARAEEVKGRPVLLTMDGLFRGLTDVVHDLAWHEWLIDANRLVRAVDPVVRERYGAETMQQLRTAIEAIAAGEATKPWALDKPLRHIRIGSMVAGLGFNLVNAMMQPLGLTNSVVRIGPRWVAQGAAAFAANPVKLAREVMGKSEFMRNRKRTQNRELNELRNRLRGQSELRQFIDGAMFLPMTAIQMTVDLPTWWGAYQKAVADGVDEDGAVQRADQAVLASQGGGQMKDLAAVQRGPEVAKLFTVFYGFFSVAYNLGAERARATNFKSPAQVARLATDFLLLYSVPAVLGLAIKEAFSGGDDDDEELAKKLGAEQVSYLFGLMVGVREATGAAQILLGLGNKSGLGYGGPAGLRFFGELQKFAQQAEQGELDRAFVRAGVNVGGIALHLPSAQINRTIDGIVALEEGRTTNPAAVIGGAPPQ